MSEDQLKVMVVDDVEDNRMLLEIILEGQYQVSCAASGRQCLDLVFAEQPDVILLDINMPEMDGYEVCRRLKGTPDTDRIPVIFISALDSVEERLAGYEAGGDEYLTKPVDEDVLAEKLQSVVRARQATKNLEQQASMAMGTAMEAMTNSSELGLLIRFMRNCAQSENFAQLADSIFAVLEQFGLMGCLHIKSADSPLLFGCELGSMEAKVLQNFQSEERVFDFGARTLVDSEGIIILIKNMPVDDQTKYGRLKDHLVVLSNSAETRLHSLAVENALQNRRDEVLEHIIRVSESQLNSVRQMIVEHEQQSREIMQEMVTRLEERLLFLGLEEDQEKSLLSLADDTSVKIESLSHFANKIDTSVTEVMQGLYKLVQQQ